jgi:hypothetical protein
MHLTSINDGWTGKLIDSSPWRHGEFSRVGLVDQEVWGWIGHLFLRQRRHNIIINLIIKDEGN